MGLKAKTRANIAILLVMLMFLFLTGCAASNAPEIEEMITEEKIAHVPESTAGKPEIVGSGKYIVQELSSERDGLSIYGVAYIPDNNQEKVPVVIISHGFNINHAYFTEYAKTLAETGVAVYKFDFGGGSRNSRSDGSMLDMSLLTQTEDLNAVIDLVQTLDFVDTNNMFLMGLSMGGAVSALVASQRPDDIRGLVLICPAFIIPDTADQMYSSADDIPEQVQLMGATVGRRFYEDVLGFDIYSEIQGYHNHVLLIHGDRDNIVPISYSERAVDIYTSSELLVLEGAGHGFRGDDVNRTIAAMIDYIKRHSFHYGEE